jgi:uncharacterized protein
MDPDAAEIRVLGCLIEKQRTTPDVYPLTLNSLRLACNQSTNRDPVVDYDEGTVRAAVDRLIARRWATLASWANRRTMKYRQTFDRELGLAPDELAVLAVLMLRGPQTHGELRTRTERLHSFESADELDATLARLAESERVARHARRPGQREERWTQLLGGGGEEPEEAPPSPAPLVTAPVEPAPAPEADGLAERVEALEREVAELRAGLRTLRDELGA